MLADARRSRDLEGWLRNLFQYWRVRCGRRARPDDCDVDRLQRYLRPEVDAPAAGNDLQLFEQVEGARRRIARLTDDQMRMADVAEANPRVLCAGGAGTGKTFLAERLARSWAEAGLQVALVCRSPWLRHFLASQLSMPGLTVSLVDGIRLDCRRAGLDRFDALIVDEGQDLFEMTCIETLDDVLAGGLEAGRWCWFHDLNNQSLTPRFDPRARTRLESLAPVRMPLRINCRNTRVILEWIQDTLDADLGVRGAGSGPGVRRQTVAGRRESAERAAREIDALGRRWPRARIGHHSFAVRFCRIFRFPAAFRRRGVGSDGWTTIPCGTSPETRLGSRESRNSRVSRTRRSSSWIFRLPTGADLNSAAALRGHEPRTVRTVVDLPGTFLSPRFFARGLAVVGSGRLTIRPARIPGRAQVRPLGGSGAGADLRV